MYWLLLACCAQAQAQAQEVPAAAAQEPPAALPVQEPASAGSSEQPPQDPAGAADDADRQVQAMYAQYVQRVAQALVASGQARETALAAMLVSEHGALRAQAAPWWQAALASAGRDGMVYHMALFFMKPHNPQEAHTAQLRQDAARRWLALDAGNLAPVLYQDVPAAQLLEQAAASTHFDLQLHASLRWIYAILRRYPPTAQEARVFQQTFPEEGGPPWAWEDLLALTVMGLQGSYQGPHYNKLFTACKPDALRTHPAHLAPCHRAAWVLGSRATTVHETILGLRMQMHLATSAQECQSLRAKSTQLHWLSHARNQQWQHTEVQDLLRYAVRTLTSSGFEREQDALRAFLRERGASTEPPPGWSQGRTIGPCAPSLP